MNHLLSSSDRNLEYLIARPGAREQKSVADFCFPLVFIPNESPLKNKAKNFGLSKNFKFK
jgi:hypothetical protein